VPACPTCRTEAVGGYHNAGWWYRRCPRCRTLISDPLPDDPEIEAHYRAKFDAGNYELVRRYAPQYRRVHEQLAGWVEVRDGDRVLDVGCFTGDLLQVLAGRGADVYGLELQSQAVEIARYTLGDRVYQADLHGEAFPPGPYAVITMMALIEHVLDPRAFIRRAQELLAPGGRLYLETPNASSRLARAMRGCWPPLAPVEHIHLFSAAGIRMLLEQEGFADVRIRAHVKPLPGAYVYEQLANFGGPGWQRAAAPLRAVGGVSFPFYVGEMFVSTRRR
jgi:SAM-dependent methyltransferase